MESNPSRPATRGEPPRSRDGPRETGRATRQFRQTVSLIGLGIFVSTFAQTGVLGRLPLEFLLKGPLHVNATDMAAFFALAALPWNIKPLAGLLSDSTPIFGMRRKYYLVISERRPRGAKRSAIR